MPHRTPSSYHAPSVISLSHERAWAGRIAAGASLAGLLAGAAVAWRAPVSAGPRRSASPLAGVVLAFGCGLALAALRRRR